MFSTERNKSKHHINQRSSLIFHRQDYLPHARDKYKCSQLRRVTVVKPFFTKDAGRSADVPAQRKEWLWQGDAGPGGPSISLLDVAGRGGRLGPKECSCLPAETP